MLVFALACTLAPTAPTETAPSAPVQAPPTPQLPEPTEARYAASHILLAYRGAVDAPAHVSRSADEAEALATSLRDRARTEAFDALARAHSDGPSGKRGGRLGTYLTGTMVPAFERAVASVEPGQLGPLVHTPFGWHVVRRDAIDEVEIDHVLIAFDGALAADSQLSRHDAHQVAERLRAELEQGADFAAIARAHSDDASARVGGTLGVIARGQMVPAFEDAAFGLAPGELSAVVETPYGFHVLRRTR